MAPRGVPNNGRSLMVPDEGDTTNAASEALSRYAQAVKAFITTRERLARAEAEVESLRVEVAAASEAMDTAHARLHGEIGVQPEASPEKPKRRMTEARLAALRANAAKGRAVVQAKREATEAQPEPIEVAKEV